MLSFMRVRLGKHNLRKRESSEQLRTVVRAIPHPGYEPLSHLHDLMLLQLAQPAHTSQEVRPVSLPKRCPRPGEACVVSGWGLVSSNRPGTSGSSKSKGVWISGAGPSHLRALLLRGPVWSGRGTRKC